MTTPLCIGFIPLVDAAALIVAVDKGFAAAEGLDVTLVREVSWSNVRDKLNIGLFDAAQRLGVCLDHRPIKKRPNGRIFRVTVACSFGVAAGRL